MTALAIQPLRTVTTLYVEATGIYSRLDGVDAWPESRDARTYAGPHAVVAHPPCQLWVNFAALNFKRWGGEHNRPGNDGGCFAAALAAVRKYGGVLEHPADSRAFAANGIPTPRGIGWNRLLMDAAFVCEVWQSAYGHKAQKRTWLYYCGVVAPFELDWSRPAGTHQIGSFDRLKPTLRGRAASATPPAFAEVLIALARAS